MKLLAPVLVCRVAVSTQELLEWGRNLKVRAVNRVTFFFRLLNWLVLAIAKSISYN